MVLAEEGRRSPPEGAPGSALRGPGLADSLGMLSVCLPPTFCHLPDEQKGPMSVLVGSGMWRREVAA